MSINKITPQCIARYESDMRLADRENVNMLNEFQQVATMNAHWPGKGTALGLSYIAGKLNGEAGEMAGQVFKSWRDDCLLPIGNVHGNRVAFIEDNALLSQRKAKIQKELGDVLWYVAAMAAELNMTLSELALENLKNLAGRTERGTLQGDGDR